MALFTQNASEGFFDLCFMDKIDEKSFMDNIRKRFGAKKIYTYIGEQVVSVNPFVRYDIYNEKTMENYRGRFMYEAEPHIYALADDTFRCLMSNMHDQCVLITGESGAGKTEASKIFMQYISHISASNAKADAENIKTKLLDSNPVLEAFGNSTTLRNDNSSRFGKYMAIQFDGGGAPVGGNCSQYLLEKSRVVTRCKGERSFHIFYNILTDAGLCAELGIDHDPASFNYLQLSGGYKVKSINDDADFKEVRRAMGTLGWTEDGMWSVWSVVAAILVLGNVEYRPDREASKAMNTDCVDFVDESAVHKVAELLECDANTLVMALKNRSISTGGGRQSRISVPLDMEQAATTRDALAKGLYSRLFDSIVTELNHLMLSSATGAAELTIGILDIYGFESLDNNSFEQICINYTNEKLQQLFIKNVLKAEQEEYKREGIQWTKIDYFDNQPIINLIEGVGRKEPGLFPLLDEAGSVGKCTPISIAEKFEAIFGRHKHYKKNSPTTFTIKHYAGDVVYDTSNFNEKNQDTFYVDLETAMQTSSNSLIQSMFPPPKGKVSKARPKTAGFQFKAAVSALVSTLEACQPHYIRCIKSNDSKRSNFLDEERVRFQVAYLNLVETVRVRRAGFCNRQLYTRFLWRYKMVSPKTWPTWNGSDKDGVLAILDHLGVKADEYALGKTKLFIKDAKTFMHIESARASGLPTVIINMQRVVRGWMSRKYFWIVHDLFRNVRSDPKDGRDYVWPECPPYMEPCKRLLQRMHEIWWCYKKITTLSPAEQVQMRQKAICLDYFGQGKKPWALSRKFECDYVDNANNPKRDVYVAAVQQLFQTYGDTVIMFSRDVQKINPKCKSQPRVIIVTDRNIFKYDPKNYKPKKENIPLSEVTGISVSPNKDVFAVVHFKSPIRDLVVNLGYGPGQTEMLSEFVSAVSKGVFEITGAYPECRIEQKLTFNNSRVADPKNPGVEKDPGKPGTIMFAPGSTTGQCEWTAGKNNINTVTYP